MRIGSRVSIGKMDKEHNWIVPDGAQVGTVIGIANGCNGDGYETIDGATVRWDDGQVHELDYADLEAADLELVDVTPACYLNLYLHDRAYGGPEEGGWWYDTYAPVADSDWWDAEPPAYGHFDSPEHAQQAMESLQAWCTDQNTLRHSPSSVASDGHFVCRLEAWPPEVYPSRRPHYC